MNRRQIRWPSQRFATADTPQKPTAAKPSSIIAQRED
jgi:hypothetical protein